MKKIFILFLPLGLFVAPVAVIAKHYAADTRFPNVYYNVKKFPKGLFGKDGKTLVSKQLSRVLLSWDLNGVIFRKEYSITANLYQIAVTEKKSWGYAIKMLYNFGKLYRYKLQLKRKGDPRGWVWDAVFRSLETSVEGKEFAALLRRFSQQANVLDYHMIALMQEISRNGHHNVVLSNMGEGLAAVNVSFLQTQLEKGNLSAERREATQFAINFLTNKGRNVIASAENNWLHKPMRESYQTCIAKNMWSHDSHHSESLTIFFDDKFSNITAAVEDGLFDIAVYYKSSGDKGCKKLRKFLGQISDGKIVAL